MKALSGRLKESSPGRLGKAYGEAKAFPFYAKFVHGFNSYGATFALFFLLATWLFFLSQFILLGAVTNRMVIGVPKAGGALAEPGERTTETRCSRAAEQQRRAS